MLPSRTINRRSSRLSHISEVDEEAFDQDDDWDDAGESRSSPNSATPAATGSSLDAKAKDGNEANTLCAGSFIGIHMPQSPSSLTANVWKVDDTICIRNRINLIPHTDLRRIARLVENNHASLRTLIMDGLPPSTFTMAQAHNFAIALGGRNSTVRTLSIRYSHVTDDIADMLALALTENTTLLHLSLEGNQLTSVAAKNFFNVIRQGNDTLRELNLRHNPSVDGEILEAIDQFMQQRELRRKLIEKREKRGRDSSKSSIEDDKYEPFNFDSVTVVCHETILNGSFDADAISLDVSSPESPELPVDMSPLPNESFMHYVQRVNPSEARTHKPSMKVMATSVLASQRLHAQSRRHHNMDDRHTIDSTLPSISRESSFTSRSSKTSRKGSITMSHGPDAKDKKRYESSGEVGVHQINEVAPGRQQRALGGRRNRTSLTESQRLARLSALTDGGEISSRSANAFGRSSTRNDSEYFQSLNTLESGRGESYHDNDMRSTPKSMFGLEDPELRTDCFACACIIVLVMIVMVMVVVYMFL